MIVFEKVTEESFTYTPRDGSPEIHIRVTSLRNWLHEHAMHRVIDVQFPAGQTEDDLIALHGLEADRMASLTEEEAKEPIIAGILPDGTAILIDGGHRRHYWAMRGVDRLRGWVLPEDVWRAFEFSLDDPFIIGNFRGGDHLPQRKKK